MRVTSFLSQWSWLSSRLEIIEMAIAGMAMILIMIVVVIGVVSRYVFSIPLAWSYDLISLYLMVAVFFLALADTLRQQGHIAIDIIRNLMNDRLNHLLLAIGYLMSVVVMWLITWQAYKRLVVAFVNSETLAGVILWPTWIAYAIVTVGAATMGLRCLYLFFGHLVSGLVGVNVVETTPKENSIPAVKK